MPWATTADVLQLTGKPVDDETLTRAQAVMDIVAGRTEAVRDTLGTPDLYFLKLATAYQAQWMASQPDLFGRSAVSRMDHDGLTIEFGPSGQTLAPLARRALRRVTWKRTRSITTRSAFEAEPQRV